MTESPPPPKLHRVRRYVPALAFLAGFTWDALTLGRTIKTVDLWILLGYLTAAAIALVAVARLEESKTRSRILWAFQFCVGGLFSALVIFYFLSSSNAPAFTVVLLLVTLMIANEFLGTRYGQMTLSWSVFAVATIMFCNFALPHLLGSISRFWFYISTAIGVVLILLLWKAVGERGGSIVPAMVVVAVLAALHTFNLIPPVPLVQKQMVIATSIKRSAGDYRITIERSGLRRLNLFTPQRLHRRAGQPLYCFTSVFVPRGIRTTLKHRWMYRYADGEWRTTDVIAFPISGGRDEGYRGYTRKRSVDPGHWRVITESESGARLGVAEFVVVRGDAKRLRTRVM